MRAAKQAGADAVKLQKRDNRRLFTRALYDAPYDNENSFGATYGEHREALELDRDGFVELQALRTRARAGLLRHGVRRHERRLPRGARHARIQDRLGRPAQHAAPAPRRRVRQADGRLHGRRHDRGRRSRGRDDPAAQRAALRAPVHGCLPGHRRGARARGDHDATASATRSSSSASPTTRTGSRWRSSRTCSERG